MNKEFIPDEQALELKELGFNDVCLGYHNIDPYLPKSYFNLVRPFDHEWCLPAPLYQQAFRWFREKYNIQSYIDPNQIQNQIETKKWFTYWIGDMDNQNYFHCYNSQHDSLKITFNTYEEAELACLKKLIEIVKDKPQKQARIQDISIG
jgi:hypothetical protein